MPPFPSWTDQIPWRRWGTAGHAAGWVQRCFAGMPQEAEQAHIKTGARCTLAGQRELLACRLQSSSTPLSSVHHSPKAKPVNCRVAASRRVLSELRILGAVGWLGATCCWHGAPAVCRRGSRSSFPFTSADEFPSTTPYPPSPTIGDGCRTREHTPRERTAEELIAFGGIADPVSAGRHVSNRMQGQPDADDLQLACAKRATMLHHVEATTDSRHNNKPMDEVAGAPSMPKNTVDAGPRERAILYRS